MIPSCVCHVINLYASCLSLSLFAGLWEALPIDNMKLRDLLLPKVRQLRDTVCHALQQGTSNLKIDKSSLPSLLLLLLFGIALTLTRFSSNG